MSTRKLSWVLAGLTAWAIVPSVNAQSLSAPRSPWALSVSGLTSHFKDPGCEGCTYRTTVPGLGLQRDFAPSTESLVRFSLSGGFQTDSFGGTGGYAAGIASLVGRRGNYSASAGLGAFGIYRFMEHGAGAEDARRVFVPAVLPVFSIENHRAGIGANLIIAPNFTYRGRDRSGFVLFQLSYRFGGSGGGGAPIGWAMRQDPGLKTGAGGSRSGG